MSRADRIPFLPHRALVAVPVTLNGLLQFALVADSGAERMVISRRAAARLGLDLQRPLRLSR
ncbi:MAG: aspartyl protease family protein [Chloroflexota bacterium]